MNFANLAKYPRIIVSGPHRSGTTICGEMIAADTGHESLREESFGWSNIERFQQCLLRENVVLQAPFFSYALHYLAGDALVVFLKRNLDAIRVSQSRMVTDMGQQTGWGIAEFRLQKYHAESPDPAVVYEAWEDQKPLLKHVLEIEYESLKEHPLWINDRSHFHFRQTR
jgi:hypothetical protein